AVYVFASAGATWVEQAYVKEARASSGDAFGTAVSLSSDGNTLAVGAPNESGGGTGITTLQNTRIGGSGVAYVFGRTYPEWWQLDYVKASNTGAGDRFGWGVVLSADARALAVSAPAEASAAIGIDGNQSDNSTPTAGAAYVVQ
ncbi:MAG TPA: integrin, partial [Kofleriaceae bacterium]|nr:integrin [Kofleriaceae bacterium]